MIVDFNGILGNNRGRKIKIKILEKAVAEVEIVKRFMIFSVHIPAPVMKLAGVTGGDRRVTVIGKTKTC